ncbi:hypothetical protein [Maridesulfovibrio sp.]|uniref:hypothetical protein n=1 Tax=Maridesulfovibrio sp. TaxID=2795000 RepID=UPI002AA651F7|nr:hypothetical protein [Maridesulfovibrio sp.]
MKDLIFETLIAAAMAAGLPADADGKKRTYEAPVKMKDALLPKPRIEIQLFKASVKAAKQSVSKFATPGKEQDYRTIRKAIDHVFQPVRLTIVSDDENWLKDFAHSLHTGLPRQVADRHNNIVKIDVEAVESTGGGSKLVKVAIKEKLTKVFHLRFTGLITRDEETAWIKDVEINVAGYQQGGK